MRTTKRTIRSWTFAVAVAAVACDPPDDTLFSPPDPEPVEVDGRFRLTFNPGQDVVRGFTPDGERVVYRSWGLAGIGSDWRMASIPREGGATREEAAIYRAARRDSVAQLQFDPGGRTLVTWRFGTEGVGTCGSPAPAGPTAMSLAVLRLDPVDGRPITALPTRVIPTPSVVQSLVPPVGDLKLEVTIFPAELEIRSFGVDPYGPTVDANGAGYVSDGATIWRIDLADPSNPPDSIVQGVFPALSPSGETLAYAVPTGVTISRDSTVVPFGLGQCIQVTVTMNATGWDLMLLDLATGGKTVVGPGAEPRFHPSENRILVRRTNGLNWIDLATGAATFIPGTQGAFSPAISPDGAWLAFSARSEGASDVFVIPLD